MANRETEKKEKKQLKDHEERLHEINDSLRRKNIRLIGVPEGIKTDRGPESVFVCLFVFLTETVFEQIIAKNLITWEANRHSDPGNGEIPPKINKNRSTP